MICLLMLIRPSYICKALAEMYGSDLLLKAHFSENGIVDLLNEMYASGIALKKQKDFWSFNYFNE